MPNKTRSLGRRTRRSLTCWGWFFVLPTTLGLLLLNIYPILRTVQQSFFKAGDFGRGSVFVGFANFEKLIHDGEVWQALINTFKYGIVEVPISIALGLVFAALLNQKLRARTVYRTIFFLPMVAAPAAVAMVWRWLYNSEFGLINNALGLKFRWISDPNIAIYALAVIGIWSVVGYNMVLFLAGMQEIPADYYEAAAIDGASGIRQFFGITLPILSPTMFFVSVTRVIASLQVFDIIFLIVERTNPALNKTRSLAYLFYQYTFVEKNVGYGSTVVVLLLTVTLLVTVVQLAIQKKWVSYN